MKGLIVINLPKHCGECPIIDGEDDICRITDEYVGGYLGRYKWRKKNIRYERCPIIPLPEMEEKE